MYSYLRVMVWSVRIMDLSPVQSGSGAKCTSDFSIDRILGEGSRSEEAAAPSWLCCTRYQPPRIPRPCSAGQRARRSGRHARVPFTAAQAAALEEAYQRAPYLAPPALRALAAALQLRDDRIKIWFQNRRARERREKSTHISPPHAITLPATGRLLGPTPTTISWQRASSSSEQHTTNLTVLKSNNTVDMEHVRYEDRQRSPFRICLPVNMSDSFSVESNEQRPETPINIET